MKRVARENIGTASDPMWSEDTTFFSGIDVGFLSYPTFADLDYDGDMDLLVSNYYGNLFYYINNSPPVLRSPNPDISVDKTIIAEERNNTEQVTLAISNLGAVTEQGLLSISCTPGLEIVQVNDITISTSIQSEDLSSDITITNYPVGSQIFNYVGAFTSTNQLVDVVAIYATNQSRSITVTFRAKEDVSPSDKIFYRAAFKIDEKSGIVREPTQGNVKDQQGYPVEVIKYCPIEIVKFGFDQQNNGFNLDTDILEVILEIKNLSSQKLTDVSFNCYSDPNDVTITPFYIWDIDNDGDIDELAASFAGYRCVAKFSIPSVWENHKLGVSGITVNGETYSSTFIENTISVTYVEHDENGQKVPYRIQTDAYHFENPSTWTWDAFLTEFSEYQDVIIGGRLYALYTQVKSLWQGRCYGMAATSNIYFENPSVKPVKKTTYSMEINDPGVSAEISRFFLNQWNLIYKEKGYHTLGEFRKLDQNYDEMLSRATGYIKNNQPLVLLMGGSELKYGHAVSLFKIIRNHDSGEALLAFYENNDENAEYPNFAYIKDNTFSYGSYGYSVADVIHQTKLLLGLKDIINNFNQTFITMLLSDQKNFFCHLSSGSSSRLASVQTKQENAGDPTNTRMLITDSSTGKRVGFVDGSQLINEINGAEVIEIASEKRVEGYAFYVPHGPAYDLIIFGQEECRIDVDCMAPQASSGAKEITFSGVEIKSGSIVTLNDLDITSEQLPELQVDFEGDGTVDKVLPASFTEQISQFQPGDLNGDEMINVFDLLDLLKVLSGTSSSTGADVYIDGKIDIFDLMLLLQILSS
ncbi:dockerin type I repeat-containing protein [Gemmatimonadota bacterium]